MAAQERTRFERHYLASSHHRERVAFAEALLHEIDEQAAPQAVAASWWERWRESWRAPQLLFSGALAAALLLSLAAALWLVRARAQLADELVQARRAVQTEAERRTAQQRQLTDELTQEQQRNQQLKAELEKLQQQKESVPAPVLLSFLLTPATRANDNAPAIIPRQPRKLQLLIALSGARYAGYRATLQTVEGRMLFSQAARLSADRAFAVLKLSAGTLQRGDYVVVLSGRTAQGATEEIDRYFLRVQ
jgi:hypothetical protein